MNWILLEEVVEAVSGEFFACVYVVFVFVHKHHPQD